MHQIEAQLKDKMINDDHLKNKDRIKTENLDKITWKKYRKFLNCYFLILLLDT